MKHGVPPPNAARYAVFDLALNLIGGAIVVVTVLAIVFNGLAYEHWSAIAGSTIWLKLILDFALSRHAHWGLDKTQ